MSVLEPAITENISKMIVNGNRLELPQDEIFKNYAAIKKTLIKAGGKYKKNGFDFVSDAQEIKDRLVGGEVIDDKKKFQFFETPKDLAHKVALLANLQDGIDVLEPSAGRGRLIEAIDDQGKLVDVFAVEIDPKNAKYLKSEYTGIDGVIEGDYLETQFSMKFDRIIANPPFTQGQDIAHVRKMYDDLEDGGRLVSIMSTSWTYNSQKKFKDFRDWLDTVHYKTISVPKGTFAESGTQVETLILIVDKD